MFKPFGPPSLDAVDCFSFGQPNNNFAECLSFFEHPSFYFTERFNFLAIRKVAAKMNREKSDLHNQNGPRLPQASTRPIVAILAVPAHGRKAKCNPPSSPAFLSPKTCGATALSNPIGAQQPNLYFAECFSLLDLRALILLNVLAFS